MTTIIFESHATTPDNEQHIASGHYDVALSETGIQQAKELGQRRNGEHFDAIFCSDLQRSYETARLAFGGQFPIIQDERLRECDYGDFEHKPSAQVEAERGNRINQPFPHGESYEERSQFMKSFLQELLNTYPEKQVLIIGHRATQYGLERWLTDKTLEEIVRAPWHWQPGWTYTLAQLS
jgi:broad specificity phosphatase PhoE